METVINGKKYWFGKWRCEVVNNKDPLQKGRLKVKAPFLGDAISSWVQPDYPTGGGEDYGDFFVPEEGSGVFVELVAPCDDPSNLVWTGTFSRDKQGMTEIPFFFQGKTDSSYMQCDSFELPDGTEVKSPVPVYNGVYPNIRGFKTPNGLIFEYDDTPDNRRIRLFHPGGWHLEVDESGNETNFKGHSFEVIRGNKTRHIYGKEVEQHETKPYYSFTQGATYHYGGNIESTCEKNLTETIKGGVVRTWGKTFLSVNGNYDLATTGKYVRKSSSTQLSTLGNYESLVMGSISEMILNSEMKGSALSRKVIQGDVTTAFKVLGNYVIELAPTKTIPGAPQSAIYLGSKMATAPAVVGDMLAAFLLEIVTTLCTLPLGNSMGPVPGTPIVPNPILAATFLPKWTGTYLNVATPPTNIFSNCVKIDKGLIPNPNALL
jgi:hypothetical protein